MPRVTKIVAIGLTPIMRQPTPEAFAAASQMHAVIVAVRDVLLRCGHGYEEGQEAPPSIYDQTQCSPSQTPPQSPSQSPLLGTYRGDPENNRSRRPYGTNDLADALDQLVPLTPLNGRLHNRPVIDGPVSPREAENSATNASGNDTQEQEALQTRMRCFAQNPDYSESDKRFLAAIGVAVVPDPYGFLEIDDTTLVISLNPKISVREVISEIAMPAVLLCNTPTWPLGSPRFQEWIQLQERWYDAPLPSLRLS